MKLIFLFLTRSSKVSPASNECRSDVRAPETGPRQDDVLVCATLSEEDRNGDSISVKLDILRASYVLKLIFLFLGTKVDAVVSTLSEGASVDNFAASRSDRHARRSLAFQSLIVGMIL